jgi:hypothetical protein
MNEHLIQTSTESNSQESDKSDLNNQMINAEESNICVLLFAKLPNSGSNNDSPAPNCDFDLKLNSEVISEISGNGIISREVGRDHSVLECGFESNSCVLLPAKLPNFSSDKDSHVPIREFDSNTALNSEISSNGIISPETGIDQSLLTGAFRSFVAERRSTARSWCKERSFDFDSDDDKEPLQPLQVCDDPPPSSMSGCIPTLFFWKRNKDDKSRLDNMAAH